MDTIKQEDGTTSTQLCHAATDMPSNHRDCHQSLPASQSLGSPYAAATSSRRASLRPSEPGAMHTRVKISSGTRFYTDVIAKMQKEERLRRRKLPESARGRARSPAEVRNGGLVQRTASNDSSATSDSNHSASSTASSPCMITRTMSSELQACFFHLALHRTPSAAEVYEDPMV